MIITPTPTWDITGEQFLYGYGLLFVALALWAAYRHHRMLGPPAPQEEGLPDLSLYELATIGGGTELAIASAASQLHRDGLLAVRGGTLHAVGELEDTADPLERALHEVVRREPGIGSDRLRAELEREDVLQEMATELTDAGLLVDERDAVWRRVALYAGYGLVALGGVRIVAGFDNGQPIELLILAVMVVFATTGWLRRRAPTATRRGMAMAGPWRDAHEELGRNPIPAEAALAAALFGGAALWLADPDIAAALAVPREDLLTAGGGGGCGGCGGCGG